MNENERNRTNTNEIKQKWLTQGNQKYVKCNYISSRISLEKIQTSHTNSFCSRVAYKNYKKLHANETFEFQVGVELIKSQNTTNNKNKNAHPILISRVNFAVMPGAAKGKDEAPCVRCEQKLSKGLETNFGKLLQV